MEMGAHSLRSGSDMEIYLAGLPPLMIMIIIKWQSDALLLYIWKQVAQFSTKVSDKMLKKRIIYCP